MPRRPVWDGFSDKPQARLAVFEPEIGEPLTRPRTTGAIHVLDVTFPKVGAAEKIAFDDWFDNELQGGSLRFLWVNPVTNKIGRYKFMGEPSWSGRKPYYVMRCRLMELPGKVSIANYSQSTPTSIMVGTGAITLPLPTAAGTQNAGAVTLPLPTVAGQGSPNLVVWFDFANDVYMEDGATTGTFADVSGITITTDGDATYQDASGDIQDNVANDPRFDYFFGARRLRRENTRTASETAELVSYATTGGTNTAYGGSAPTSDVRLLTEDTSTGPHELNNALGFGALDTTKTWCYRAKVKPLDGQQYVKIRLNESGAGANRIDAIFDVVNKTVVYTGDAGVGGYVGSGAVGMPGGYTYVWVSGVIGASASASIVCRIGGAAGPDAGDIAYIGNSERIVIAEAQLEEGAFPTSVIQTSTTRTADDYAEDLTGLLGTELTLLLDVHPGQSDDDYPGFLSINNGGTGNEIQFFAAAAGANDLRMYVNYNGANQTNAQLAGSFTYGARYRLAMRVAANDVAGIVTGGAIVTDTSATFPVNLKTLNLRAAFGYTGSADYAFVGVLNRLLTDAELEAWVDAIQ